MIEIERLTYQYHTTAGSITALRDVSLRIAEGASVAITGPNGSGKTTLARCLNGLLRPTSGRVLVDGVATDRPDQIWAVRQKVGMIFQNPDNQLVSTTVEREVAFGLENLGVPSDESHRRVDDALARFELERYRHHAPHLLSGGEKQRLAVASVWAMRPKYVVLDEPTALLDSSGRREVLDVLRELADDPHIAVVHITQSPEEAAQADRLIVMHQGQIVMDDPPAVVFARGQGLRAIGLQVPVATQLADGLRVRGVPLPRDALGVDALMRVFLEYRAASSRGRDRPFNGVRPEGLRVPETRSERPRGPWIIETRKLSHLYDPKLPTEQLALSNVDLAIAPGEFLALIGSTGSGKTTLVQHFNGLLKPSSGRVLVEGQDLWQRGVDLQRVRQQVGLVFQFPELQLFEDTAAKDVAFGPRNLAMSEEQVGRCVQRTFEELELDFDRFADRSPFELSEGEKRRVAIAGVLAMLSVRPAEAGRTVLVLDEPTAGLDHQGTRQIAGILRKLHAAGRTIVMICHDMDLVAEIASRVVALDRGEVRFDGTPWQASAQEGLLDDIGLDLPWAASFSNRLRAAGWRVRANVLNIEELQEEIVGILGADGEDRA